MWEKASIDKSVSAGGTSAPEEGSLRQRSGRGITSIRRVAAGGRQQLEDEKEVKMQMVGWSWCRWLLC